MAAADLLFSAILCVMLVPPPVPARPAQEDKTIPQLLEKLRSSDPAEREAGLGALKKLPLDKLPLLEPALSSPDLEVATGARKAMSHILNGACSRPVDTFELRAEADDETFKTWQKAGSDREKPPEGYEVVASDGDVGFYPAVLLVRKNPVIAAGDIKAAAMTGVTFNENAGMYFMGLELREAGTKAFETLAANDNFKGVVVVDGRVAALVGIGRGRTQVGLELRMGKGHAPGEVASIAELLQGKSHTFAFALAPSPGPATNAADAEVVAKKAMPWATFTAEKTRLLVSMPRRSSLDLLELWQAMKKVGWTVQPK